MIDADADLRALVLSDQAVAVQREQREDAFHYVGGARSFDSPTRWFTPSEPRMILGDNRQAEVRFTVAANGKINLCHAADDDTDRLMATRICALLRQRARMVPPVFDEEKSGHFEIRRARR
ncbi:hypothetical protein [Sphingopyxis sp. PET50]|uniref:hypothetical protein n=1 Tax=Sphingopyxis sp. PET50 TaxID=2976533 RepID=UPI0021AF026E|nr:hypothetical protein [Sphingopyxis sp. PET50]